MLFFSKNQKIEALSAVSKNVSKKLFPCLPETVAQDEVLWYTELKYGARR